VIKYPKDDEDDMHEDPDYVPPDDVDYDEPGEYDSEYESHDSMSISDEDNADRESDPNNEIEDSEVDLYSDWLAKTLDPQVKFSGEPVGHVGALNKLRSNESVFPIRPTTLSDGYDPEELEHIPGRTCTEAKAYSGFAISLEEMRGCRTAQFLIHKSVIQDPSQRVQYLEPWEVSEEWFLSGLRDGMPSRDENYPYVWPARGGLNQPRADNINFDVSCLSQFPGPRF
jgi:hypothetical protein